MLFTSVIYKWASWLNFLGLKEVPNNQYFVVMQPGQSVFLSSPSQPSSPSRHIYYIFIIEKIYIIWKTLLRKSLNKRGTYIWISWFFVKTYKLSTMNESSLLELPFLLNFRFHNYFHQHFPCFVVLTRFEAIFESPQARD